MAQAKADKNRSKLAHLRSISTKYAGFWLDVVPSTALKLSLSGAEFITLVKYWLGKAIYPELSDCPLCGSIQDKYGYHALICKKGGDGGYRHDHLRDSAFPYFRQAGLNPDTETPGLIRDST